MERLIERLIQDFEEGKSSRRQLIRALAVAASAAPFVAAQTAVEADEPLKVTTINHISYQVADYKKTRDFYSHLFGMKVTGDDGKQCNLAVGDINLVVRNGTGATPAIDHIAYTVDNWDKNAMLADLTRRQLDPKSEGPNSFQLRDPDGYHVQLSPKR
jgi:catechol 2,3-dioxygenase-like lactoylglutathione lyase family enzyme